jgi:hypothetical protein
MARHSLAPSSTIGAMKSRLRDNPCSYPRLHTEKSRGILGAGEGREKKISGRTCNIVAGNVLQCTSDIFTRIGKKVSGSSLSL